MSKNKKITIIILVVLCIGLVISLWNASTYALFSSDKYGANYDSYSTGLLSITAKSKSENISLTNALPMSDDEGKLTTPYVFTIKNVGNLDYKFDVKLLSTGETSSSFPSSVIKLQIDDGDVLTLSSLTDGIIKDDITLLVGESIDISIRIWLDIESTTNDYLGMNFESKIVTDGYAIYTESNYEAKVPLVEHITNLYNENIDEENPVTNNGIAYNYARIYAEDGSTNGGLMNDRHDSEGNLLDDANAGNIRYYGASPNNYINFNCKTYPDTDCETWRIIGLFKDVELSDGTKKDLIKVVRSEPIGDYSWDTSDFDINYGYGINEWSQADLMKLLNSEYSANTAQICVQDFDTYEINCSSGLVNNSLWWNSGSGLCYKFENNRTEACDFTNSGLNSVVHNKIETVVWNLGGWDDVSVYANQIYEYERQENVVIPGTTCSGTECNDGIKRKIQWTGKVALAYPSDYGYAVDLDSCRETLDNYYECRDTNWLLNSLTQNSKYDSSWLLTPNSSLANGVWNVHSSGNVINDMLPCTGTYAGVWPAFYLSAELIIVSGDGSSGNPYRLSVG